MRIDHWFPDGRRGTIRARNVAVANESHVQSSDRDPDRVESGQKVVQPSEYSVVAQWCLSNPGGSLILGISTSCDARSVCALIPRHWRGAVRFVFVDQSDGGMKSGPYKTIAVTCLRVSLLFHKCDWRIVQ